LRRRGLDRACRDALRRRHDGRQMTAGKPSDRDRRAERLAAALKENLKRRKAQARGRAADDAPGAAPEPARERPDEGDER
jgi:hypothetical protein